MVKGLGNLVSRVMTMAVNNTITASEIDLENFKSAKYLEQENFFAEYQLNKAMDSIWKLISVSDALIQTEQPFKTIKTDRAKAESDIKTLLKNLIEISIKLRPFLPDTAKIIQKLISENKKPEKPLFLRKD